MGSYSMTLKECLEMWTTNQVINERDRIEKGRSKLFDFDYPIFDASYKNVFETHFIRTFYMREIGFETEGLFKFYLETWLLVNMPYYNKMFESELIQFDPLSNTKIDTTQQKKNDRTGKTTGENQSNSNQTSNGQLTDDNFNRHLKSDNPDSRLQLTANDGQGVIEYASEIDENTDKNKKVSQSSGNASSKDTTSVNNQINEIEDFIESKFGKIGNDSYSKMVQEYRQTFLRIEKQIFNEMNELFMLVY